jgi:hypothetical protein
MACKRSLESPPPAAAEGKRRAVWRDDEEAERDAGVEVRCCFSTKESVTLTVNLSVTGLELKRKLSKVPLKQPYFVNSMRLLCDGRPVPDEGNLRNAGFRPGGTVYVLYSPEAAGEDASDSDSDDEEEEEEEEEEDAEAADRRTMAALVVQALKEVVQSDASLALDVLRELKEQMQALDATLAPHQLDLFDDRQFQSLLFSLISCPGLMQELRQREDLQVKALLPGLSSMDALTELYHSEEEAQHTLATCLRALQAMFGTAAGRGALDRLIGKVTDVVTAKMAEALLESYKSDEDEDYDGEGLEGAAACYGGSSEAMTSAAEAAEELRDLRPADPSLPRTRSMARKSLRSSGTPADPPAADPSNVASSSSSNSTAGPGAGPTDPPPSEAP